MRQIQDKCGGKLGAGGRRKANTTKMYKTRRQAFNRIMTQIEEKMLKLYMRNIL